MNIEQAKQKYKVVLEVTHWYERIYGAYLVLFKGYLPSNGKIIIHYSEPKEVED